MTASIALALFADGLDPVQQVGEDPNSMISPGLGGFLAVFFIALATVLLVRSMTRHLRKVRYSTPPGEEPEGAETVDPTDPEEPADPQVTSRG